jgi:hypothetical protein
MSAKLPDHIRQFIKLYPLQDIVRQETTGTYFNDKKRLEYISDQNGHDINEIEVLEYIYDFEINFWDKNEEIIYQTTEKKV